MTRFQSQSAWTSFKNRVNQLFRHRDNACGFLQSLVQRAQLAQKAPGLNVDVTDKQVEELQEMLETSKKYNYNFTF